MDRKATFTVQAIDQPGAPGWKKLSIAIRSLAAVTSAEWTSQNPRLRDLIVSIAADSAAAARRVHNRVANSIKQCPGMVLSGISYDPSDFRG